MFCLSCNVNDKDNVNVNDKDNVNDNDNFNDKDNVNDNVNDDNDNDKLYIYWMKNMVKHWWNRFPDG